MRATDLIGCDVYDLVGERVGTVHDLRFEMTWTAERRLTCRLTGLDCRDSGALGHRLGYGTGDMAGPWPLSAIFTRRRERLSLEIDWRDVASVDPRRIGLNCSRRELTGGRR